MKEEKTEGGGGRGKYGEKGEEEEEEEGEQEEVGNERGCPASLTSTELLRTPKQKLKAASMAGGWDSGQ